MRNTPGDRMNDWFWGELSLLMVLAEAEMWSLSMTVAWGFHNLVCWTGIAWWALIKSPVWGIWNEQLWWWRVCQKAFMQIKLLLEKQNASYTNSLGWEQENTESTAACGVDAGAYWEFSTLQCWWDGFFFSPSLLVWRLLMHDWSSISILLPETHRDAPDLEHLKHLQLWKRVENPFVGAVTRRTFKRLKSTV